LKFPQNLPGIIGSTEFYLVCVCMVLYRPGTIHDRYAILVGERKTKKHQPVCKNRPV